MNPAPRAAVIEVADLRRGYRVRGRKGLVTALDGLSLVCGALVPVAFWPAPVQ